MAWHGPALAPCLAALGTGCPEHSANSRLASPAPTSGGAHVEVSAGVDGVGRPGQVTKGQQSGCTFSFCSERSRWGFQLARIHAFSCPPKLPELGFRQPAQEGFPIPPSYARHGEEGWLPACFSRWNVLEQPHHSASRTSGSCSHLAVTLGLTLSME